MTRFVPSVLLAALTVAGPAGAAAPAVAPDRVIGLEDCAECHEHEHAVWQATSHARGWTELARDERTRSIARSLGILRVKREASCVSCHFLSAQVGETVRPVAGVACESCHGAAAGWIDLHWDFGPGDATVDTEAPDHRVERLRRSDDAGFIRPGRIAELGARCYGCHVVDDERAIELGGHPQTELFDLAAATQGDLRHNFLRGGEAENAPASLPRLRVLHVLGRLLDLEASLAALATASPGGSHAAALRERVTALRGKLTEIGGRRPIPEVTQALAVSAEPSGESASILSASSAVGAAARAFAEREDGADLAALDSLLPERESRPAPQGG